MMDYSYANNSFGIPGGTGGSLYESQSGMSDLPQTDEGLLQIPPLPGEGSLLPLADGNSELSLEPPKIPQESGLADHEFIDSFLASKDVMDFPGAFYNCNEVCKESIQIERAADSIKNIKNLDPEIWEALNVDDRHQTLQMLEEKMANIQGRPPVEITIDDNLGPNEFGMYDPASESITVNGNHLNGEMSLDENVKTVIHEGRHAYQNYAIHHPGFHPDSDLVSSWANNQNNYLSADEYGQEIYESQPLEADAFNYETQIWNVLNQQPRKNNEQE